MYAKAPSKPATIPPANSWRKSSRARIRGINGKAATIVTQRSQSVHFISFSDRLMTANQGLALTGSTHTA